MIETALNLKPVPNLHPLLIECPRCKKSAPMFLFKREEKNALSISGSIAAALGGAGVSLVCYDCFYIEDIPCNENLYLDILRRSQKHDYVFSGSVPAYDTARRVIQYILEANECHKTGKFGEEKEKRYLAEKLKMQNNEGFLAAIVSDINSLILKNPSTEEPLKNNE